MRRSTSATPADHIQPSRSIDMDLLCHARYCERHIPPRDRSGERVLEARVLELNPWSIYATKTIPIPESPCLSGGGRTRPLFAKHSILDVKENRLQPYIRTFDETCVSVPDGICETAPHHFIALTVLWTPQVSPFAVRPHCHHVMIACAIVGACLLYLSAHHTTHRMSCSAS